MRLRTWFRVSYAAASGFVLVRLVTVYDALPQTMASHFDHAGRADGHMPKDEFVPLLLFFQLFMTGMFGVLGAGMPGVSANINIPNKSYWLAPERRASTLQKVRTRVDALALAISVLLAGMVEGTVQVNLDGGRLPYFGLDLGLFGVFFVGWMVTFIRAFPAPPPSE